MLNRVVSYLVPQSVRTALSAGRLQIELKNLRAEVDALRSRADLGDALLDEFRREKLSDAYQSVFAATEPLVSVCVGTYNRADKVVDRCVRSILAQGYRNLQVLVIGDACTDDTAKRLGSIQDSRLHFENLAERGHYPDVPHWRWMVAGTATFNRALQLSEGSFITHLDDDDEYLPERIDRLVACAREKRADLVFHPFWNETQTGQWELIPADSFTQGNITTSSVLYHRWFRRIGWDINAYRNGEPGDANRFRKLRYLGPDIHRFSEPLLRKYR